MGGKKIEALSLGMHGTIKYVSATELKSAHDHRVLAMFEVLQT